ncbi:autotransporter outer membrane beta-barrel domain-containing protein [Acidocella aminolytica]|nr:autotransporter outer membrane beta-barrel domain-containing protein [Acidocella aminolytica]
MTVRPNDTHKSSSSLGARRGRGVWPRKRLIGALALLGAVFSGGGAMAQSASPSCSQSGGGYGCTVPAGTYTEPLTESAGALLVSDQGTFNIQASSAGDYGLNFISRGVNGANSSSGNAGTGTAAGYESTGLLSNGALNLTGSADLAVWEYGLLAQSIGGNGGNYTQGNDNYNGGNGGSALGNVYVGNYQPVTLTGEFPKGVTALEANGLGGNGGSGASGGSGGYGGVVQLENYAPVTIGTNISQASGDSGGVALEALSQGGAGGESAAAAERIGGAGGPASIYNTQPVTLYWSWQNNGAPSSATLYGLLASSIGGKNANRAEKGQNGGPGGSSGQASVSLIASGDVYVSALNTGSGLPNEGIIPPLTGAAVAALSQGGAGGQVDGGGVTAGAGGTAGANTSNDSALSSEITGVSDQGASVGTYGNNMAGIEARNIGGAGGDGNYMTVCCNSDTGQSTPVGGYEADGGSGGGTYDVQVELSSGAAVNTAGIESPGIVAAAQGGAGGDGATYEGTFGHDAGNGGAGGNAGDVIVNLAGSSVLTTGSLSSGIVAFSTGGNGGGGGNRDGNSGDAGGGGNAGAGGDVTVDIQSGTGITTTGSKSPGVVAESDGGAGGNGGTGSANMTGSPRPGGNGGTSGLVTATLESGASISTAGNSSPGFTAVSLSGAGGNGNTSSNIISSQGGPGGTGGQAGSQLNGVLTAVQASNGGSITTQGADSPGLLAQAQSGGGGAGGTAGGIFAEGGTGATAGAVGLVTAQNLAGASIATSGSDSTALLAQSISGGGGDGGNLDFANSGIGGSASFAANAGAAEVSSNGIITTSGYDSFGILDQSIGGGGGIGGSADNIVAVGGAGGGGGGGGNVTIDAGGSVNTTGDLGAGVVAQSIGGGGGKASDVTSYSGIVSLTIGGSGGSGGAGGAATVNGNSLSEQTSGGNSTGVAAESAGGGGGVGGAAYSVSVSAGLGVSLAVGGKGGDGGNGGNATVNLGQTRIVTASSVQNAIDPTTLSDNSVMVPLATDSYGVLALSVGGGGGIGGSSLAKAFVQDLTLPTTESLVGFAVSGTWSQGGSGGAGGNGGSAAVNLSSGDSILTYGNGAHAVMAQSIGGGGGDGGDSSAQSTAFGFKTASKVTGVTNYNLDLEVSLGGSGGASGNGGSALVNLGGNMSGVDPNSQNAPAQIVTLGDNADGVLLQSIGGGGGNAGEGSGSTQNGTSSSTALTLGVTLGAAGSSGGNGGYAGLSSYAGTAIETFGDSAYGIEGQSIGGGGGTSSGSSYQLGLPSLSAVNQVLNGQDVGGVGQLTSGATLTLGTSGTGGGSGGQVVLILDGTTIITNGQAADGIVAQSVGGGGGIGGSAGSTGSSDDPNIVESSCCGISQLKAGKKFANALGGYLSDVVKAVQGGSGWTSAAVSALNNFYPSLNLNISVGGSGGSGGVGGSVSTTFTGSSVTTKGDYADAILAQSIGGGGGIGGGAVAGGSSGLGSFMKINANFALGASGGDGGAGGAVSLFLGNSSLTTQGYAAYGVFAQSVGRGGGTAGSAETDASGYFSLGASGSAGGSAGGNGGSVMLTISPPTSGQPSSSPSTIATAGDVAHAVFLQSVGGGGGEAGDGFTLTPGILPISTNIKLRDGGTGTAGDGGAVSFVSTGAYATISTGGASAYGILAQSIGGGGGVAFTQLGARSVYQLGGGNGTVANGGAVSIQVGDGIIKTTGDGSHAIFAQSVGGGGGIAGFASGSTLLYEASAANGSGYVTTGNGGDVTVNTGGTSVITTGASAYGIFAQSVGAGGGLESGNDGVSEIAGTTGATGSSGTGGLVTVFDNGTINASGVNAVGIFAQSIGQNGSGLGNSAGVAITVNGSLSGGSGTQGRGIWVDSDYSTNNVTIGSSGLVRSASKQAIVSTGYGITNVQNYGTVIGTVTLKDKNSTLGTFTNEAGGLWISSGSLSGNFVNAGRIAPLLANNYEAVSVAGDFQQTASGVYAPNVQFDTRKADMLLVTGNAQLAGIVEPVAQSVLPWVSVPIMTVDGTVSGRLSAGSSPLFGYEITKTAASSDASIGGNETQYLLTNVSADFDPSGVKLSALQSSIARALFSSWEAGGNASFGTLYGALDNLAQGSIGSYTGALANLAPEAAVDYASREVSNLEDFAGDLDGCDRNGGDYLALSNGRCAWFTLSGNLTSQSSSYGAARFALNQSTYAIGGETRLSHNLYLDAALAYQNSWLSAQGNTLKGSGQAGYGGVGLRDEVGDWSFMGGLFGSGGAYTTSRVINLPGEQSIVKGSPAIDAVGVRTGAAYMFGFGSAYIRPRLTLDGLYINMPGYTESGSSVDVTKSNGSSQGIFVATPSVEFGKSFTLRHGMELRLSFLTGVSLQSSDSWTQSYGFIAAPAGTPDFNTTVAMDTATARIGVGLQLVKMGRYSLRAEYNGAFSKHTSVNAGDIALHATF